MAADSDADMEVAEVTDSEEERNREAEEAGIENLQSKLLISNVRKYFLKDKCILFFRLHKKCGASGARGDFFLEFERPTDCLRNDLFNVETTEKHNHVFTCKINKIS